VGADDRNIKRNVEQRQKCVFASRICYNELTVAVEGTVQAILSLGWYAAVGTGEWGCRTGEQRLHLVGVVTRLLV